MTLGSTVAKIGRCNSVHFIQQHISIVSNKDENFYIEPHFNELNHNLNSKFLIFSAPGATGKTALATHLVKEKNGLYWDLSKIKLGENSLHGTFARALGYNKFPDFIENLKQGKAFLVIDSFDEADLISGRSALEFLLNDLNDMTDGSIVPSIVLLARTETALFLSEFCKNHKILYSYYEISTFSVDNAKKFIIEKIKYCGKTINSTVNQCIERQFNLIKLLLERKDDIFESFIGYAPVLEALASSYDEELNTINLLNSLSVENGFEIVYKIVEELLLREQIKIQNALRQRWEKDYPDFQDWDMIYTIKEQIVHIICFLLFGDFDDLAEMQTVLPESVYPDYIDTLKNFLIQHPFIKSTNEQMIIVKDFTSPAFRDFCLAHLLSDEKYYYLAVEYFHSDDGNRGSSQLLFDFYLKHCNRVFSNLFIYLYESFKSKETIDRNVKLDIYDNDDSIEAKFMLFSNDDKMIIDETLSIQMEKSGLLFRHISNAHIDVNAEIHISNLSGSSRINNSNIICRKLYLESSEVLIEVKSPNECILVSNEVVSYKGNIKFDIRVDIQNALRISFVNINDFFKLRNYTYDYSNDTEIDSVKFEFIIKKFVNCLRKHKKDTPARDREFIDNTIVGHSALKRNILDFLISQDIFYIDANESHLYKLNIDKLDTIGLRYLSNSQDAAKIREEGVMKYSKWVSKEDKKII